MDNKTVSNNAIEKEIYMGKVPVLTKERIYNFRGVSFTTAGIGVASWCYVQGGWMASVLPINLALLACIAPLLLMGLIMLIITTVPTKFGIENFLMQGASFGYKFARVLFIISILIGAGWYTVNAQIFATSSVTLAGQLGFNISEGALPWIAIACFVISFFFAIKGPQVVKISLYIMVPCLVGIGILLLVKAMLSTTWDELMSIEPIYIDLYPSAKIAFLIMVEGMFAFALSWYPILGQFSRLTDSRRSSYWGHAIGFILAMSFFCAIGAVTGTLMATKGAYSDNPTDWMLAVAGPIWGVLSLVAIALANISTQITGLYCWSLTSKTFWTKFDFKAIAAVWTVYCIILALWDWVWTYYNVFLAVTAVTCGAACAIMLADYFVIRKAKFSLKSIYQIKGSNAYKYTGGFNIVAVIAFAIGILVYFMAYDPINYMGRNDILMLITPTGSSCAAAFISYVLIAKIPVANKYLLKDRKEIEEVEAKRLPVHE